VVSIDIDRNALIVGEEKDCYSREFILKDINWIALDCLKETLKVKVKIRPTMNEEDASIRPEDSNIVVKFESPQWAITPGQSAVFYDGDIVIGGGIISQLI